MTGEKVERLVGQYAPLAKKMARRYGRLEYEDAVQEAYLGLTIAALRFDERRGYFAPFARKVIENRLNQAHNVVAARAETSLEQLTDGPDYSLPKSVLKVISITEHGFSLSEFADLLHRLDEQLMKLMQARLQGRSQKECATMLGVSQPTVSRMLSLGLMSLHLMETQPQAVVQEVT